MNCSSKDNSYSHAMKFKNINKPGAHVVKCIIFYGGWACNPNNIAHKNKIRVIREIQHSTVSSPEV